MSVLRRVPVWQTAVMAGVVALLVYAVLSGDGGNGEPVSTAGPASTAAGTIATFPPAAQFVSPLDGAAVANPVTVRMAIGGVRFSKTSEPARAGYGHLIVIIDGAAPAPGQAVPRDGSHVHLDDASHVVTLPELPPGPHTLTLVFADSDEVFQDPSLTDTVRITVTQ